MQSVLMDQEMWRLISSCCPPPPPPQFQEKFAATQLLMAIENYDLADYSKLELLLNIRVEFKMKKELNVI